MKKGLLAVVIVLTCALIGAGVATAAEVSTSGAIEFTISGTSEEGAVSGTFGAGDVLVDYNVEVTSGAWGAVVSPEFDIGGGTLAECDAYITYTSDMATLTLDPTGIDYGLYDVEGAAGGPNIPSNPGIKVEVPFEPITLTVVANNEGDGTGKLAFHYGLGVDYAMESLTLGVMVNSASKTTPLPDWYGTAYGLKVEYEMAPMTFIGEYGSFSPSKDGLKSGSGYYAEFDYATDEMGDFVVSYTGADKNLNGAGVPTTEAYSKIYGEWGYPLTDAVTFTADVTSENVGAGTGAITTYEAKIGISF